jgi:hypothetical protein
MPNNSVREAAAHVTRNPIMPRPIPLAPNLKEKKGPGTLRTAASLAGPSVQIPSINAAAQSARSNAAAFGQIPINRSESTNARVGSRDGLTQTGDELYGTVQ